MAGSTDIHKDVRTRLVEVILVEVMLSCLLDDFLHLKILVLGSVYLLLGSKCMPILFERFYVFYRKFNSTGR